MELSNVVLNGVRLEGQVTGSRIAFQNTVENNATIIPFFGSPLIFVNSSAELSGSGRIELRNGAIQGSASSGTLINGATHTIFGPGTIGGPVPMRFVNRGLVEATNFGSSSTQTLQLNVASSSFWPSAATINSGTLRARNGSTLVVAGTSSPATVFENFEGDDAGVIEADVNSTVQLSGNYTLRSGILRSIAPTGPGMVAGKVVSSGSGSSAPQLRDLRLEGAIGDANSIWRLTGEIENTGELRGREIYVDGTATLTGGGHSQVGSKFCHPHQHQHRYELFDQRRQSYHGARPHRAD
jgi:hypothetical protein